VLITHLLVVIRQPPEFVAPDRSWLGQNWHSFYDVIVMIIRVFVGCVL